VPDLTVPLRGRRFKPHNAGTFTGLDVRLGEKMRDMKKFLPKSKVINPPEKKLPTPCRSGL
jgi:hypothetical protein